MTQHLGPFEASPQLSSLTRVAIAVVVGILLATLHILTTPVLALGAVILIILALISTKRPELLIVALVLLTASIFGDSQNPSVSIGIGTIYLTDIIILAGFGLILMRWLAEKDFNLVHTPLDWPLLIFSGWAFLSTAIAISHSGLPLRQTLGEVRTVASYLVFFLVTNLLRTDQQIRFLIRAVFLLAIVVALAMFAQYLVGYSLPLLPGRVEVLTTEGQAFSEVARIIPPGESLLVAAFLGLVAVLAMAPKGPPQFFRLLQLGVLGVGITLTFKRNLWVGLALALLGLAAVLTGDGRRRLFIWGALGAAAIGIVFLMSDPQSDAWRMIDASLERLQSLSNIRTYSDPNSSLRWRDLEYEYAIPQIAANPLFGLGLGASYRPYVPERDPQGAIASTWIHNGHVWIALKAGLPAYLAFAWLSSVFIYRGLKYWRQIPDLSMRGVVLGFTLAYMVVLLSSVVNANVMVSSWALVVGIMMGIGEVILRNTLGEDMKYHSSQTNLFPPMLGQSTSRGP